MLRTAAEEVVALLSDMYSVELQALAQLARAPKLAREASLAFMFEQHSHETEQQAELVRTRLEELGGSSSTLKNAVMKLGGRGFLLFARVMPETPGRLVAHAYAYEAMEWAGYEVLERLAEQSSDVETADVARAIGAQERAMMARLEQHFDVAEAVSHRGKRAIDMMEDVVRHLTEVHALEMQSLQLLAKSEHIAGSEVLTQVYREHLEETHDHARLIELRLRQLCAKPSKLKDAALRFGAMNWGLFFQAQRDTPAKLAVFAYAVEHLEIAAYELLRRTAIRACDEQTHHLCERILPDELAMAARLEQGFDAAVEAALAPARESVSANRSHET